MKRAFITLAILAALLFLLVQVVAWLSVDSIMFRPPESHYDETLRGYVDIGTGGEKIAAVVRGPEKGRKAIIYCHGNAEDISSSLPLLEMLANGGCTVAAVDYPGYGFSDGKPTEAGCYRNVHRLYDWLIEKRGFAPSDIAVIGFSIGTGPAVELAEKNEVSALVLEAPFLSAPRIFTKRRLLFIDPFPNEARIGGVKCPLLVIHGTADGVVPFEHGKTLFDSANEPKFFVPVEGAGHNDFIATMGIGKYRNLIHDFIWRGNVASAM